MFSPRWSKVLHDLWNNRTRTGLTVLSVAVGLFTTGMIVNAKIILDEGLRQGYAAINPSHGIIRTAETFGQDFVRSVRRLEGVADADARAHVWMRFQLKPAGTRPGLASAEESQARWSDLEIFAVPDYDALRVNKIRPSLYSAPGTAAQTGAWPPPPHELLMERSSLEMIGAQVGDSLIVETARCSASSTGSKTRSKIVA
jgi:putative ABC transport system permease protein